MFGVQRRCQQLEIHEPVLKCKLFDTLVKTILCYCCLGGLEPSGYKDSPGKYGADTAGVLEGSAWCSGAHQDVAGVGRVQAISSACYMAVTSRQILAAAGVPLF